MEGLIVDDSYLYVVDPTYFVLNEEPFHMEIVTENDKGGAPFAGMVDVVWGNRRGVHLKAKLGISVCLAQYTRNARDGPYSADAKISLVRLDD